MDAQVVAVLGRGVLTGDEPIAYADELGLTRGDGCFDATLVRDGRALYLDAHLARLERSAAALELDAPPARAWRALVDEALTTAASAYGADTELALKLVLTRGREHPPRGCTPGVTAYLLLSPLEEATRAQRAGIDVVTLDRGHRADAFAAPVPWLLGGVKSLSYAVNLAAKREATRRGAQDALFVSTDGYALEAPTAALVWHRDGAYGTTRIEGTGILDSVTAGAILARAAAAGRSAAYGLITPAELPACDGAWLCSSVRGVAPMVTLDGTPLPQAAELTAELAAWGGFRP